MNETASLAQEKERQRQLVEAVHREAIQRLAGTRLPASGPATIHFTDLVPAGPGDPLFQEWNTYRHEVGRLLAEGHEGRFVLIKDNHILGIFSSEEAALAEGSKRHPCQAFLVHQIREREPVMRVRGYNLPCPSSSIPSPPPA